MVSHFVTLTKKGEAPSEPKKDLLPPPPRLPKTPPLGSWSKMNRTIKMQVKACTTEIK